jgi:hypothetical protein
MLRVSAGGYLRIGDKSGTVNARIIKGIMAITIQVGIVAYLDKAASNKQMLLWQFGT